MNVISKTTNKARKPMAERTRDALIMQHNKAMVRLRELDNRRETLARLRSVPEE